MERGHEVDTIRRKCASALPANIEDVSDLEEGRPNAALLCERDRVERTFVESLCQDVPMAFGQGIITPFILLDYVAVPLK